MTLQRHFMFSGKDEGDTSNWKSEENSGKDPEKAQWQSTTYRSPVLEMQWVGKPILFSESRMEILWFLRKLGM